MADSYWLFGLVRINLDRNDPTRSLREASEATGLLREEVEDEFGGGLRVLLHHPVARG